MSDLLIPKNNRQSLTCLIVSGYINWFEYIFAGRYSRSLC